MSAQGRTGGPSGSRPVMYDVARRAGVSHQTVSRVVNDHPHVRESTRLRVQQAMAELGYRPNSLARGLASRRSRTVGVLGFDSRMFGPASTLQSIEQAARGHGYGVLSASLGGLSHDEVQWAVDDLLERSVDGLIIIAPRDDQSRALATLPADLPVVALESDARADLPMVGVDNVGGGELVAHHLLSLGHAQLAQVTGPRDWPESRLRSAGFEDAVSTAGAQLTCSVQGDWSARSGYAAGRSLLDCHDITAVFAGNDQMALGLLTALYEAGVSVPGQVSVVGFDNEPHSEFMWPALTTVDQQFRRVGLTGLEVLLRLIDGEGIDQRTLITPLLVRRASASRLP